MCAGLTRPSQSFVDLGQDKIKRAKMLQKFVAESLLSQDQFNCTGLNSLRKAAILRGKCPCQGQTVKDESGARRLDLRTLLLLFCRLGTRPIATPGDTGWARNYGGLPEVLPEFPPKVHAHATLSPMQSRAPQRYPSVVVLQ